MSTGPARKQSLPTGGGWRTARSLGGREGGSWDQLDQVGSSRRSLKSSGLVPSLRALESNQAVGEVSFLAFWGESSPLEKKTLKEERGPTQRDQN